MTPVITSHFYRYPVAQARGPDLWPSGGARVSFLLVTHASPFLSGGHLRSQVAQAEDTCRSECLHTPAGSRGNTSVCHICVSCCSPATPRPLSSPTYIGRWQGSGACHSLGQGHVGRVQQELLPAVGAHELHGLLVQAHLPETRPSHAHRAWRLPGGRGSRGRAKGWLGREEAHAEGATG